MNQRYVLSTFNSGNQNISVCCGFPSLASTSLVGTIASFDRSTFSVIIHKHILPFVCDVHDDLTKFILQVDYCRPHRAKTNAPCLDNEIITRIKWTAQMHDFNPIENAWGLMKTHLRKCSVHPRNQMHFLAFYLMNGTHNITVAFISYLRPCRGEFKVCAIRMVTR